MHDLWLKKFQPVGTIASIFFPIIGILLIVPGVVFGILVLAGAFMMLKPETAKIGGVITLIFSVFSIIIGGGFVLGMILGIIGGIVGLIS